MPTKPEPPTPASARRARFERARRGRLSVLLVGAILLAGCTREAPRTGAPGEDARRALVERRTEGPIRAVVQGNPFGMDELRLDSLVTRAMAAGVSGLDVSFTTYPDETAPPEPHLVVILNPAKEPPEAAACGAPETVATTPAAETLNVFALFCQGAQALDAVHEEDRVAGPTDHSFERLLWRTSASLFPDDYANTYGFGILPRWLNFGVGGSFGL